jgi:tetraether lipid synthase
MPFLKHDATILETTQSYCPICKNTIPAQIVSHNKSAYIVKQCPLHGEQWELREEDAAYYINRKDYDKPGTDSIRQTEINRGCPWDCGLCPTHQQHTCIGLIEITNACNLECSDCYAHSADI